MKQRLIKFGKSFYFATRGILIGIKKERNMKVHTLIAVGTVMAGFYFRISTNEWIAILTMIGLVMTAELINSSFEELANIVRDSNKLDYQATAAVRDMAAGAVLVVAVMSVVVGAIIFSRYIF